MLERVIFAGFGGQGVLTIGKMVAELGMDAFPQVTYFPSYGTEVRGGTANCQVILSSREIASPIVDTADSLILMNQPSLEKFFPLLKRGGIAFGAIFLYLFANAHIFVYHRFDFALFLMRRL